MSRILTIEQREKWVKEQSTMVSEMFYNKYMNGAIEHKTDLGEISHDRLIEEMICEALDQLAYALEIQRRRALSKAKADRLAKDIEEGRWSES
jgi:hypothetical protein